MTILANDNSFRVTAPHRSARNVCKSRDWHKICQTDVKLPNDHKVTRHTANLTSSVGMYRKLWNVQYVITCTYVSNKIRNDTFVCTVSDSVITLYVVTCHKRQKCCWLVEWGCLYEEGWVGYGGGWRTNKGCMCVCVCVYGCVCEAERQNCWLDG